MSTTIVIMVSQRRRDPPAPVQEADNLSAGRSDLELCSYTAFKAKLSDRKKYVNSKEAKMLENVAAINEWYPRRDFLPRRAKKSIK
jgi:hypothetical protein